MIITSIKLYSFNFILVWVTLARVKATGEFEKKKCFPLNASQAFVYSSWFCNLCFMFSRTSLIHLIFFVLVFLWWISSVEGLERHRCVVVINLYLHKIGTGILRITVWGKERTNILCTLPNTQKGWLILNKHVSYLLVQTNKMSVLHDLTRNSSEKIYKHVCCEVA